MPLPTPQRFFQTLLRYPKAVIALSTILFLACVAGLPQLVSDTTIEAFIREDDPVRSYRDQIREDFGLDDPMVIAVTDNGPNGVFTPSNLDLVARITEAVIEAEGIDPDQVTSLATENYIAGDVAGLEVNLLMEEVPTDQEEANLVREAVMGFPLYVGSLVGRDGQTTLIAAKLLDDADGSKVYLALQEMAAEFPNKGSAEVHVAGEGAVSGYLAYYISSDAQRLNPIAGLIITLILLMGFRTGRAVALPNLLVAGAVGSAVGVMAWTGVPFFVITNALPVLLIAIAVADGIHIMNTYYELQIEDPDADQHSLVVQTMTEMWRPITLTSITDMGGFMAVYATSAMPPMKYFGIFAAIGVMMALFFSVALVPAILVLMKKKPSPTFKMQHSPSRVDRLNSALGRLVWRNSGAMLVVSALVVILGIFGATRLVVNDERIDSFAKSEPLPQADAVINGTTDGSHYIDIVVETGEEEGMFRPDVLHRMEALQEHALTLAHVNGGTSLVDYVKQMHKELNEGDAAYWRIPENAETVAQLFLLYTASASATDFEDVTDGLYQQGILRLRMDTQNYAIVDATVNNLETYIAQSFNEGELTATVSGAIKLYQHWLEMLKSNHFWSVAVSLLTIWLLASAVFRSFVAGLLSIVPVSVSLLFIYAVMGYTGITLSVGTSMFAAISLGAGIDFAIHSIDRFIQLVRERGMALEAAFDAFYTGTGRALFYSFACLIMGFGVLTTSSVVTLIEFGVLMGVSAFASFLASMTLLPALLKHIRPAFLGLNKATNQKEALLQAA